MIALALAVLTIAIYSDSSDHGDARSGIPTAEPIGDYMPAEVRTLLRFVDSMTARGSTAGGHEFAAAGVRYVAAALGTVATSAGLNIDAELETIREHATHIETERWL